MFAWLLPKAETLLLSLANYFHYVFAFGADSCAQARPGQFNGNEIGFGWRCNEAVRWRMEIRLLSGQIMSALLINFSDPLFVLCQHKDPEFRSSCFPRRIPTTSGGLEMWVTGCTAYMNWMSVCVLDCAGVHSHTYLICWSTESANLFKVFRKKKEKKKEKHLDYCSRSCNLYLVSSIFPLALPACPLGCLSIMFAHFDGCLMCNSCTSSGQLLPVISLCESEISSIRHVVQLFALPPAGATWPERNFFIQFDFLQLQAAVATSPQNWIRERMPAHEIKRKLWNLFYHGLWQNIYIDFLKRWNITSFNHLTL